MVSGETANISSIAEFKWYEWVMFRDTSILFPDSKMVLGRDLGPALDIGPAMTRRSSSGTERLFSGPQYAHSRRTRWPTQCGSRSARNLPRRLMRHSANHSRKPICPVTRTTRLRSWTRTTKGPMARFRLSLTLTAQMPIRMTNTLGLVSRATSHALACYVGSC